MKKRLKEPITSSALRKAASAFTRQTDRGTALIVAAWLDDALEACLRALFRPDKEIADKTLQPDGPLGSFAARIRVAYLLGIITSSMLSDLEIIRSIRNDFAHLRQSVRFSDQSIKARCNSLKGVKAFQEGTGEPIRSPRQMFLISAFLVADCLLEYADTAKPSDTPELDLYVAIIHRTAKSMTLRQMKNALERLQDPHSNRHRAHLTSSKLDRS